MYTYLGFGAALASVYVVIGLQFNPNAPGNFRESQKPITATVLSQAYQSAHQNKNSKYTLKLRTDDGRIIGLSIVDAHAPSVSKESLDAIIDDGSRISFPMGNYRSADFTTLSNGGGSRHFTEETYFTPETQAGNKRADRVTVLSRQ